MASIIMITPYFGPFPEWMEQYQPPVTYDWLLYWRLNAFKKLVKDALDIDFPGEEGSGKVWDYRPCLGVIFQEAIKDYDFWGHTDFDCVYGDVNKYVTDEFLSGIDVHSNHSSYVNGCWTLYRNIPEVNNLFRQFPGWKEKLIHPEPNGWVENEYSRLLEQSGLRYKYTFWQGNPYTTTPNLKKENGKLYQDGEEIMMFHFRRSKKWPL